MAAPDGTYNVTDDEPVISVEYTGSLARMLDAPQPRRIPEFVGRLALGKAVTLLTNSHRVSNQRFQHATGGNRPTRRCARDGAT